jgi:hypothetical protein
MDFVCTFFSFSSPVWQVNLLVIPANGVISHFGCLAMLVWPRNRDKDGKLEWFRPKSHFPHIFQLAERWLIKI